MIPCLQEMDPPLADAVNQAVFLSDSPGPASSEYIFQGFRLADDLKTIAKILQARKPPGNLGVRVQPNSAGPPKLRMKHCLALTPRQAPCPSQLSRLSTFPLPATLRRKAESKRRAFRGDRNR